MMTFSSLYNIMLSLKLIIAFIRMYLMLYAPSPALRPRQQGPLPLAMSFRVWLSPLLTPPCHRIHRGQGDWVMPTWNLRHYALLDLVWNPGLQNSLLRWSQVPLRSFLTKADGATVYTL